MQLYDMARAPNPRRVRIFLAEKGIAVDRIEIDIAAGANRTPAYLAINPRGTVPALRLDNGLLIDESGAIIRYFEALHPEPPLLGRTPAEIAEIDLWDRRCELAGMQNLMLAYRNSAPLFAGRSVADARLETRQEAVLAERGLLLARRWLDDLEERLARSPWVGGTAFSLADISAYVCLDFAKRVDLRVGAAHPSVAAFHARMKQRPSAMA
jgi:glutathione S-transferase